jgi:superfamily I DNA and/or RNA helicase
MDKISDVLKYYKDCLFEDGSDAIFAPKKVGVKTYIGISGEELSTRSPLGFSESEKAEIQDFIKDTLKNLTSASFWYGYPILYVKNNNIECLKPIFFVPIRYNNEKIPEYDKTITPRINKEALEYLGFEKNAIKSFAENIGLYDDLSTDIAFTKIGDKLKAYFSNLKFYEGGGKRRDKDIIFRGALFYSEQSSFTKGLDFELKQLIEKNITKFKDSCLDCYFTEVINSVDVNKTNLFEVFELNDSQKAAVSSAFQNKMTVVTGPPGTGKSQVVASIIINAMLKHQKVLFASRNQKAIQVIEEKFKKLLDQPFFIRLGKQDNEGRNLRGELIQYLQWLSRIVPDSTSFNIKKQLKLKYDQISEDLSKRERIKVNIEELRKQRNIVLKNFNQKEAIVEQSNDYFNNTINLIKLHNYVSRKNLLNKRIKIVAKYLKSLNQIHNIHSFEYLLDELEYVNESLKANSKEYTKLWLDCQPLNLDAIKRKALNEYILVLENLSTPDLTYDVRNALLNTRNELLKDVVGFLHAWCVTNLSISGEIPLIEGFFDIAVIDEASQCDIPSVIPLLYRAKRVVVLGDSYQLRHISTMSNSISLELLQKYSLSGKFNFVKQSFYDLSSVVANDVNKILLNEHFRSHADIISFSKDYPSWYNGNLLISTDYRNLNPRISKDERAVIWIDVTGEIKQINGSGAYITNEIQKVTEKAIELVRDENFKGSIGIVTPFSSQAFLIRKELNKKVNDIERNRILVNTTVKFQGDEKDIIIFSPVVSTIMPKGVTFYYQDSDYLLNVSITRARAKLFIIGDQTACLNSNIQFISAFAKYVKDLTEGKIDNSEKKSDSESIYEEDFHKALNIAGIKHIQQHPVGQYRLDFAITVGDLNLNIEVDGKKYHTDLTGERLKSDIIRNQRLQNLGWKVIRFWSYEIKDKIDYCINRIKAEIKEHDNKLV